LLIVSNLKHSNGSAPFKLIGYPSSQINLLEEHINLLSKYMEIIILC
jgi:hypothetical protein